MRAQFRTRLGSWMIWGMMLALPWLLLRLQFAVSGAVFEEALPYSVIHPMFTDGLYYWHQGATFAAVGFDGGYYSVAESPALIGPFYTWGAATPAFYGLFGALFGYPLNVILVINTWALTLALAFFIWVMRPGLIASLLVVGAVFGQAAYWFYASASMTVTLQLALAVALAAPLIKLMTAAPDEKRRWALVTAFPLTLASLIVPLWATLWLPLAALLVPDGRWRRLGLAVGAGLLLFAAFFGLYWLTASPYPNAARQLMAALSESPAAALAQLGTNIGTNLEALWTTTPALVSPWEQNRVRLAALALLLLPLAALIWRRDLRLRRESLFHAFNLGSAALLMFPLYRLGDHHELRVWLPRVLLSLLLLIGCGRRWLAGVFIAAALLMLPTMTDVIGQTTASFNFPAQLTNVRGLSQAFSQVMQHEPNAPSPWCNSVMIASSYLYQQLDVALALPPGFGLGHRMSLSSEYEQIEPPFKSRYLLLDSTEYGWFAPRLRLEPLFEFAGGGLYRNLDSACPA